MRCVIPFVFFILFGCVNSSFEEYNDAIKVIIPNEVLKETNKIVVLPRAGCTGCISEATHYVLENYQSFDSTCTIITEIDDIKKLKATLPDDFLNSGNVFLDKANLLSHEKTKSVYPYILNLGNGSVLSKEDFENIKTTY